MRLTPSGIVFVAAGVCLSIVAYRFRMTGLLPVGILLVFLTLLSAVCALVSGARLKVRAHAMVPTVGAHPLTYVGRDTLVRITLTNALPIPTGAFYLNLEPVAGFGQEQGVHVPAVPAQSEVHVDAVFTPSGRGISGLKRITVAVEGPFRLSQLKRTVSAGYPVAVAPPLVALTHPSPGLRPRPLAESPRISRGMSTRDFYTREYVPGDDLRHIHWKTVARTGQLMVRQEADEDIPAAAVIVHGEGMETSAQFDLLVAAAMSAVHALAGTGYHVFVTMGHEHIEALPGQHNYFVDAVAARAQAEPAQIPPTRFVRTLSQLVVCALDADHAPLITGAQRVHTHKWYATDIDSQTLSDMNFSGIFGGDTPIPAQWNLRGI